MAQIIGAVLTLAGSLFLFLGALGLIRMPDLYNRMQAGTKTSTLGSILFLAGISIGFFETVGSGKIVLLIVFILFTNPISSHALARAAHCVRTKMSEKTVRDDLQTDKADCEGK